MNTEKTYEERKYSKLGNQYDKNNEVPLTTEQSPLVALLEGEEPLALRLKNSGKLGFSKSKWTHGC